MRVARVIPCLDVTDGRVVKGVNFVDLRDAGDPVELAARYDAEGADELVFLDITASSRRARHDGRRRARAPPSRCSSRSRSAAASARVDDARRMLRAGADKVSVNTAAVAAARADRRDRRRVRRAVRASCAIDASAGADGGAAGRSYLHGGRTPTGVDARRLGRPRRPTLGAGEILLTSMDRDGTTRRLRPRADPRRGRRGRRAGDRQRRRRHARAPGRGGRRGRRRRRARGVDLPLRRARRSPRPRR